MATSLIRFMEGSLNTLGSLTTATVLLDRSRVSAAARAAAPVATTMGGKIQPGRGASDGIFGVNHIDANKMKVNLMERLGKAFGLDLHDFADASAMARVIKEAAAKMPPESIQAVEKAIGLDKLAVSLNEMLDAMSNPGGDADKKLTAALREQTGDLLDDDSGKGTVMRGFGLDEVGRYSSTGRFG